MPEHLVPYAHRMTDAGEPNPSATRSHEGVRPEFGDPLDPITAALLAAIEARRQSHTDIGVLTALQRAADYCTDQLRQRLDKVIADANAAQQLSRPPAPVATRHKHSGCSTKLTPQCDTRKPSVTRSSKPYATSRSQRRN